MAGLSGGSGLLAASMMLALTVPVGKAQAAAMSLRFHVWGIIFFKLALLPLTVVFVLRVFSMTQAEAQEIRALLTAPLDVRLLPRAGIEQISRCAGMVAKDGARRWSRGHPIAR